MLIVSGKQVSLNLKVFAILLHLIDLKLQKASARGTGQFVGATLACEPELGDAVTHPELLLEDLYDRSWSCLACIQKFQMEVDAALPGMYVWFSLDSLHITLRALT